MYRIFLLLFSVSVLFTACKKDEKSQSEIDEELIQKYISDNNIDATRHESGVYYIIKEQGVGSSPNIYSSVLADYRGYLIDGTEFDSGTLSFVHMMSLMSGWQIGMQMLKLGGEGTFIIPSGLAYGGETITKDEDLDGDGILEEGEELVLIPPHSILIFDVKLIDFK